MTPEEAVVELVAGVYIDPAHSQIVLDIIKPIKTKETRRCAARVQETCNATGDTLMKAFGKGMANDLLTTGGLEAVE